MSSDELPIVRGRSWADIERIALGLVSRFYPNRLTEPGPIPVDHFVEIVLPKHFKVQFDVGPLPNPSETVTMPGGGKQPPWIVMASDVFESLKAGNGRARFSAAHEAAHALLHAKELNSALVSGRHVGLHRHRATIRPYQNPERQADVFASRFLMPAPAVRLAHQHYGPDTFELADLFQVSLRTMFVRLGELSLEA